MKLLQRWVQLDVGLSDITRLRVEYSSLLIHEASKREIVCKETIDERHVVKNDTEI